MSVRKINKKHKNSKPKNKVKVNRNSKRIMMQCKTAVNKDAVKRVNIDGVEHIIVSSFTLPDDIVMNGVLYPAEEIEKGFSSLEMTFAPVEHPKIDGDYVSAFDPRAVSAFHVGAYNANVRREDGRVHIDKYINVSDAMRTEKGKRLLDRIEELETSKSPRPIHTSVGVYLSIEHTDDIKENKDGLEYSSIGRDFVFDHDAILLDSQGAAQPNQGVGVAVNKEGDEIEIDRFSLSKESEEVEVDEASDDNADDDGALESERNKINNQQNEGEKMKELILNALKKAGVKTDGLDENQLLSAYNDLQSNDDSDDDHDDGAPDNMAEVVANAVSNAVSSEIKPLKSQIEDLQTKLNEKDESDLDALTDVVVNSGKYPDLEKDDIKKLGFDTVKKMAGNSRSSFAVDPTLTNNQGEKEAPAMPE